MAVLNWKSPIANISLSSNANAITASPAVHVMTIDPMTSFWKSITISIVDGMITA